MAIALTGCNKNWTNMSLSSKLQLSQMYICDSRPEKLLISIFVKLQTAVLNKRMPFLIKFCMAPN